MENTVPSGYIVMALMGHYSYVGLETRFGAPTGARLAAGNDMAVTALSRWDLGR
jgi:hypothetical protein